MNTDFRVFLQEELIKRCEKNPRYSLRAFAQSLQMDFSSLSKILSGKRPLGKNLIRRLGTHLALSPDQVQGFVGAPSPVRNGSDAAGDYQQLSLDTFKLISDWHHYAILELMRLDHFEPKPSWIAKRLGTTVVQVNGAIERLIRIGILEITEAGKWIDHSGGRSTTVGNEFTASAFRRLQRQVLEKALDALETVPMQFRDQTSMTMAIDRERLPEAKERIKKFRRELATFLSRGNSRNEVYNLGISLYPVTQISKLKGKSK